MFTSEPDLLILPEPDYWAIRAPLTWEAPDFNITIPAGFITDLASIPRILRNVLDVDGRSRCPAILHDFLYSCQRTTRSFADEQLRLALIAYGDTPAAARLYWLGVRIGGWVPWEKRLRRGGGLQPDDFMTAVAYRAASAGNNASIERRPALQVGQRQ